MTGNEIFRMVEQAVTRSGYAFDPTCDMQEWNLEFAKIVYARAIEDAAKVCDDLREKTLNAQSGFPNALDNVMLRQVAELGFGEAAAAIRERGVK